MRIDDIVRKIHFINDQEIPRDIIKGILKSYFDIQEYTLLTEGKINFGDFCFLRLVERKAQKIWSAMNNQYYFIPKRKVISYSTRKHIKAVIKEKFPPQKIKKQCGRKLKKKTKEGI